MLLNDRDNYSASDKYIYEQKHFSFCQYVFSEIVVLIYLIGEILYLGFAFLFYIWYCYIDFPDLLDWPISSQ